MYDQLFPDLQRCMEHSSEKGSSSRLSVLPLEEGVFYLHKEEFRDALCLRYGWRPTNMLQICNCDTQFTVGHAMICHMGCFPMICHNEIQDITASLLTEVCHNVATEPTLQVKTLEYGQQVQEIERGVFTPLVLYTTGDMGKKATTFYKQLADMIASKCQHSYSVVMGGLKCRLSFASLCSSVII